MKEWNLMLNLVAIDKFSNYLIKKRLQYIFQEISVIWDKGKEYGSCIFVFKVAFKAKSLMHCDHWLLFYSCRAGIRLYVPVCQIWALITYAFKCTLMKSSLRTSFRRNLSKLFHCFQGDCSCMSSKTKSEVFLHLDASKGQTGFQFHRFSIGSTIDRTLWRGKGERSGVSYSAREHWVMKWRKKRQWERWIDGNREVCSRTWDFQYFTLSWY